MKHIKKLSGSYSSTVELVELDGRLLILKTVEREEIVNEKAFQTILRENNIPCLEVVENDELESNQVLLEYIENTDEATKEATIKDMYAWGKAVRKMHSITFQETFRILETGEKVEVSWNDFIKEFLQMGIERQAKRNTDMSENMIIEIEKITKKYLLPLPMTTSSLLHCDLHTGNFLYKDGELILYDKGSSIMTGDPRFDLALVALSLPCPLLHPKLAENKKNSELLGAFIDGYGENFCEKDREIFLAYVLLRGLDRYPNPFETTIKGTMEAIIS